MSDFKTVFSAAGIDRCGTMRTDPQRMAEVRDSDAARFLLVCDDQCLAEDDRAAMLARHEIDAADDTIFLGRLTSHFLFAIRVDDARTGRRPI